MKGGYGDGAGISLDLYDAKASPMSWFSAKAGMFLAAQACIDIGPGVPDVMSVVGAPHGFADSLLAALPARTKQRLSACS